MTLIKTPRKYLQVSLDEEKKLKQDLEKRTDTESLRLKRYIAMPDLTRTEESPLKSIVDMVINLPDLKNFDIIATPEIISPEVVFDLFNFPKDHPARSQSDTYYINQNHILRPHTSLMWKYYTEMTEIKEKLIANGAVGALCYGKVYRKDEIDWQHSNVLHQFDGLFICEKNIKEIKQTDLENICFEMAASLLGENIEKDFRIDHFPYTDPSIEMNIKWGDKWVEINGAGLVHPQVIRNLGLDPNIYNGWAFGFGVDRLAMLKMKIPDIRLLWSKDERVTKQLKNINNIYQPVSKYPPVIRDISFIVNKNDFNLNRYFELIREVTGDDMVEEAKLLDSYEDQKKFGSNRVSYTFRIIYRSNDRTLTSEEISKIHNDLYKETAEQFKADLRI